MSRPTPEEKLPKLLHILDKFPDIKLKRTKRLQLIYEFASYYSDSGVKSYIDHLGIPRLRRAIL